MRYKQLAAHSKDAFCGAFAEPFQAAHKAATAQVVAMNAWYTETSKILSTGMDYSLADLDTYLHSADGEFCFVCFARALLSGFLIEILSPGFPLCSPVFLSTLQISPRSRCCMVSWLQW